MQLSKNKEHPILSRFFIRMKFQVKLMFLYGLMGGRGNLIGADIGQIAGGGEVTTAVLS